MLRNIAVCCTEHLIDAGIVERKKEKIYIYGLELFISTISSVFSMLLIAAITNHFLYGILFLLIFMPLRMTANGYHAKTFFRCFVLTNSVFILYLFIIMHYSIIYSKNIYWVLFIISVLYIFFKAPIEHPLHKLTEEKRKKNRLYAHIILGVDITLIILLLLWGQLKTVYSSCLVMIIVAGMMIIKNSKEE